MGNAAVSDPGPSAEMRVRVLGVPVDLVDMHAAVARVTELASHRGGRPSLVVTLNPEMVMHARHNRDFAAVVQGAALIIPDGIGVVHALRRRGFVLNRVGGADLVDGYLAEATRRHHRVALAGAAAGVAERAAQTYSRRHPGLVIHADGGDPSEATAMRLSQWHPDVVLAAYGHGRQERFLADHMGTLGAACGIGVGGTLDYAAGVIRRAPGPVRSLGLEWAWRLARQPQRLGRQLLLPAFWWQERREFQMHPDRWAC